jgi:thioredoxin
VLVDAWAPGCGPCRPLAPVIDELAAELSGRVRVVKLNVDENPQTARRFELRSIPTLIVMRSGREVARLLGARPKSASCASSSGRSTHCTRIRVPSAAGAASPRSAGR